MTYKYETLKEIKELPKYKQLVKQLKEAFKTLLLKIKVIYFHYMNGTLILVLIVKSFKNNLIKNIIVIL